MNTTRMTTVMMEREPVFTSVRVFRIALGRPTTMPAKMMKLMPFAHGRLPGGGNISIGGWVRKSDTRGGDGVTLKIVKNGDLSSPLWQITLAFDDPDYHDIDVPSEAVSAGDRISFHINSNGTRWYDATQFDAIIIYE